MKISSRYLHKSCSARRALSNGIQFVGYWVNFRKIEFWDINFEQKYLKMVLSDFRFFALILSHIEWQLFPKITTIFWLTKIFKRAYFVPKRGWKIINFHFGTKCCPRHVTDPRKTIYPKMQNLMENIMLFKFLKNIK